MASLVEQREAGRGAYPWARARASRGSGRGGPWRRNQCRGPEQAEPPAVEAPAPPTASESPDKPAAGGNLPAASGPKRPTRYGLSIQFESRPDDPELGRLLESTVWVNEAHPAYRRAVASRSEGYHVALTVAMALASLAVEPPEARGFITAFLEHWGEALDRGGRKPRSSGRGGSR